MTNILITGVGGPQGQAIVKAARLCSFPTILIGTDREPLSVGFDWVDHSSVLPDCSDELDYVGEIIKTCVKFSVDLIIPASESELRVISENADQIIMNSRAKVVATTPQILDVCLDKLETCEFLKENELNYPDFAPASNEKDTNTLINTYGFPLIAKPCRGSGSQGIFKIKSQLDLDYVRTLKKSYVVQEYLKPDNQEYTVGIYTDRHGLQKGGICMRREIAAGNTYRAWVSDVPQVLTEASRIVECLQIRGPCNVQLRLTERGPIPFEINPRFSGTTGMRAHFGYNEVEMAIRDIVLHEVIKTPEFKSGIALRFWEEHYQISQKNQQNT